MSGFRPFEAAISADLARAWRLRDYLSAFDPRVLSIPAPPAGATPEPPADEVQAGEPGPATADGTAPVGPGAEAGPGEAQDGGEDAGLGPQAPTTDPAPGAAQESDPAAPPAGDGQPGAAPGAEQDEAGPAVEHETGTETPMAPCLQPMAHGVWEDARGPLPAECDVPEHHETAPDAEQADDAPEGGQQA